MAEALEEKIEDQESKSFMRKALDLCWHATAAAGTSTLSMAALGSGTGLLVGGAFGAGMLIGNLVKGNSLYDAAQAGLLAYSGVNAVIAPVIWLGDATIPLVGSYFSSPVGQFLAKSAYAVGPYNAAFVGMYDAAAHIIQNKLNPRGMWNSISDNFMAKVKRIGTTFAPGYILAANGVPMIGGIPTFAYNAGPVGLINSMYPVGEENKNAQKAEPEAASALPKGAAPALG